MFRYAAIEDAEAVSAVLRSGIASNTGLDPEAARVNARALSPATLRSLIESEPANVIVSVGEEGVNGAIVLTESVGGVMYITWVCVPPEARQARFAGRMFDFMMDEVARRGFHSVWGVTLSSNRGMRAYVKRFGFREVGIFEGYWFNQDYVVWQYNFAPDRIGRGPAGGVPA